MNSNWSCHPETLNSKPNHLFSALWLWNLNDDLEKIIAHLFYATSSFVHHFVKLWGSFYSHLCIQTRVTIQEAQFLVQSCRFFVWPWNLTDELKIIIGDFYYALASFVHHFVGICEFKLELQSGNAQIWAKFVLSWPLTSWPQPFAWTSLLPLVITPENFMMIGWQEQHEKGVTDTHSDTDRTVLKSCLVAAKNVKSNIWNHCFNVK